MVGKKTFHAIFLRLMMMAMRKQSMFKSLISTPIRTTRIRFLSSNSFAHNRQRDDAAALDCANLLLRRKEECTFRLNTDFVDKYSTTTPPFGFNGLGELVYMRAYSRLVDGTNEQEQWFETVRRVVEGCFSLQWRHCESIASVGFDLDRAKEEAEDMYDNIFHMRFLPPGRGLWAMGTAVTEEKGAFAALNNCAFVSTANLHNNPRGVSDPFVFLMDAAMLGVGVGFDVRGAGSVVINMPQGSINHIIQDSREGWVESVRALLDAYLEPSKPPLPLFDYSKLRPAGTVISGFGGTSQGPEPLRELHQHLNELLIKEATSSSSTSSKPGDSSLLSERTIVDVMNMIGRCIVSSNVRRTAEIAFGFLPGEEQNHHKDNGDGLFLELKDYKKHPERAEYGWVSNNSVLATVGKSQYGDPKLVNAIRLNGEPGFAWPDNMATFGRMRMPGQHDLDTTQLGTADGFTVLSGEGGAGPRAGEYVGRDQIGGNPCLEQTLESYELCCLVECFPERHLRETKGDHEQARFLFLKTLKSALLYAKTVSLAPTHWSVTNQVMSRNRRLGVSMSGIQQFISRGGGGTHGPGLEMLRVWCEEGYSTLRGEDHQLSARFSVRPSIKLTSIKPSGSVSLLAGATPGLHWPEARYYLRRVRLSKEGDASLIQALINSGYHVEGAVDDNRCDIVSVPVCIGQSQPHDAVNDESSRDDKILVRTLDEVSMFEQLLMASFMQRHWADNQVSCTVTFDPVSESAHIPAALAHFQYMLKGISFLPRPINHHLVGDNSGNDEVQSDITTPYPQMPYERITKSEYEKKISSLKPFSLRGMRGVSDREMPDLFCENDRCDIPVK